jgi:Zn-dependent M32 family carboxypeptidase
MVFLVKKNYDRKKKIPKELVEEAAYLSIEASQFWVKILYY